MMPADRQATTVSYPQRFGNETDKRSTNTFNTEREMNANVFQDSIETSTSQKLIIDFSGNNATTDTQKGNQRAAFPGLWSKGFQNLT